MMESAASDNAGTADAQPICAAQYVRMSTDRQQYSTRNQMDALRAYAEARGIRIVRTYADEGRSGLRLKNRPALKKLLRDVHRRNPGFSLILVYDVSRWGRFQDADESAHYEFVCRQAGITVAYCAEQFVNDGSPVSAIFKGVKRAMAGEYSRELSVKVLAGQHRIARLGFRVGGPAGYGVRRCQIDRDGRRKFILEDGERKAIQTDRVILVPGPLEELRTLRWIFETYVAGTSTTSIAAMLNERGILSSRGGKWSERGVSSVLHNEKYIGNNVWCRTTKRLSATQYTVPPEQWARADGAFEPVIPRALFDAAQERLARKQRYSKSFLLGSLRRLYEEHGHLSRALIDRQEDLPSSKTYGDRFGSLQNAYALAGARGISRDLTFIGRGWTLRKRHPVMTAKIVGELRKRGAIVEVLRKTGLLLINGEFTLRLSFSQCLQTRCGPRWIVRFSKAHIPDITLAIRMSPSNSRIMDYFLLPRHMVSAKTLYLNECNTAEIDACRVNSLAPLLALAGRANILEIAS